MLGGRFSRRVMGISRTSRPMRWARMQSSLAKRSRSTTQARAVRSELARDFPAEEGPIAAAKEALLHAPAPAQTTDSLSDQPAPAQAAPVKH